MQLDLFAYPRRPGWKEPDTSRLAAARIAPAAELVRSRILAAIAAAPGGLTADEACAGAGVPVLTGRPRVTELKALGEVEKTSERRKNGSGASAAVWRAKR